jgi:hypothetical protein
MAPPIEREMIHVLFMNASTPIEKIVKSLIDAIKEHELFMPTLLRISNCQADNQGKKTFRLKDEYLN